MLGGFCRAAALASEFGPDTVAAPHAAACGRLVSGRGCIEANETAWQTALREVTEETGLRLAELWSGDFCEQFYEADKDRITMLPVFIGVVPPDAEVVLNAEHDGYKWLGYEEADRLLAFPGQRKMLAAVKAGFIDRQPHALLRIPIV